MYKSIFIVTLALLASLHSLIAQPTPERFEQIKATKVAFLTQKMDLSVKEAEKFWPLYNELEARLQETRKQARISAKSPTEQEARDILYTTLDKEEKETALKREFYEKASKVISYQKLYLMELGEKEFRIKILERYRNMRKQR